jgi:hypothetical protein
MRIELFAEQASLNSKTELEKSAYLCFYLLEAREIAEFTTKDIKNLFNDLHFSAPNLSRLSKNLKQSKHFIKGSSKNHYRLHSNRIKKIREEFPNLKRSEQIASEGSILPDGLFINTRGYIEKLCQQINAAYENNLFDACSVIMRRLLEILLIHCFQKAGKESSIKESDGYKNLKTIMNIATSDPDIKITTDSTRAFNDLRELGNLSAHGITYTCKRGDIDSLRLRYRAAIEDLLNASGIKK